MDVRPLRLVGASAAGVIESALAATAADWAGGWGIDAVALSCSSSTADEAQSRPQRWRQGWQSGTAKVWLDWSADCAGEIERLMFSPCDVLVPVTADGAALAPSAAAAALDALLDALSASACGSVPREPLLPGQQPDTEMLPLSGALVLTVGVGGGTVACLLDEGAVSAWSQRPGAGPAPGLPKLGALKMGEVFGPVALALPVRLGSVDVDLASLMSVAAGDVIRLDVSLDSALEVTSPDGKPLFAAHLGRVGPDMAIELAAAL